MILSILELLKEIDTWFLLLINSANSPFGDVIMHYASIKFSWIPLYAFLLFLIIKRYKKNTFVILVFVALTIALSDQVCLHFFKNVFLRYRPCHNLVLMAKIHLVDNCGGKYGFISSHAANAFALAFFINRLFYKESNSYKLLFIWAAFVSYSRIYLGQHYPSDVFVGALVGISAAFLCSKLYFYTSSKLKLNYE